MTETRWRVRKIRPWEWHEHYRADEYVGVKGDATVYGDSIADVMNGIAFHEGEVP